jgi:hypothetical protein
MQTYIAVNDVSELMYSITVVDDSVVLSTENSKGRPRNYQYIGRFKTLAKAQRCAELIQDFYN